MERFSQIQLYSNLTILKLLGEAAQCYFIFFAGETQLKLPSEVARYLDFLTAHIFTVGEMLLLSI